MAGNVLRLAAALALSLAALIGGASCSPRPSDCKRADVRCAGLVTDFGAAREGLSGQAWLAMAEARASGYLDRVDYIETVDTRDRSANIRAFADGGYDIIVFVGAGISDEALRAAIHYPEIDFVGIQPSIKGEVTYENVAALAFHEERSGFLAGAAAGLLTRTGRVAAVCEVDFIDSIHRTCEGFRLGALHIDPDLEVEVRYRTGSEDLLFRDLNWGSATAIESLNGGADVLFAIGGETAEAALLAAGERDALLIGAELDQYSELPELRDQIVTSAVLEVQAGLLSILRDSAAGRFPTGPVWGDVGLAPFRDFEHRLDPDVILELEQIATDLNAGLIRVEVSPQ